MATGAAPPETAHGAADTARLAELGSRGMIDRLQRRCDVPDAINWDARTHACTLGRTDLDG
jgi:hypothetical protein